MDFSNKTLAWFVVATIVISMTGTIISINKINNNLSQGITGYAASNATGNVTVTIASQTVLQFISGSGVVGFGTGSIDGSYNNCTMYVNKTTTETNTSPGCLNFATNAVPLVLENAGNTILNVTLNFTNNATTFIGGGIQGGTPHPLFQFTIYQNETGSCTSINRTYENFTSVAAGMVGNSTHICTGLNWQNTQDTIGIGILIMIPADATGTKQVNITAQGTG